MSSPAPTPSSASSAGADNIPENKQMSPSSQKPVVLQPNDVISGRGNEAKAYNHPGNMYFRHLVKERRLDYVASQKRDKPAFAKEIVHCISNQKPPGRFMKVDKETGLWFDIGYKQALMKTRQALREGAPMIGKKIQTAKHLINRQKEAAVQQQQEAFMQASMIQQHAMQQAIAARNGAMLPNFVSNNVDLSAGFPSAPKEQNIDPTSMQNILNNNIFPSSQITAENQHQLSNMAQPFLLPVADDILRPPGQGIPRMQGNEIHRPYFAHPRFPQQGENTINSSFYSPPSQGLDLRANTNVTNHHLPRLPQPSLSEIRIQNNYVAANPSVRNATPQFFQQRDYYTTEAMNKIQESNPQLGHPRVYPEGQQPNLERDVTHFQHHRR